jgi:hypothetical protein
MRQKYNKLDLKKIVCGCGTDSKDSRQGTVAGSVDLEISMQFPKSGKHEVLDSQARFCTHKVGY